jgi:hypothetical protein
MLQDAANNLLLHQIQEHFTNIDSTSADSSTSANVGDILNPWTIPTQLAPEEADDEHPCSFPEALHFLELTTDEAVAEYRSLFSKHVQPAFAENTDIIKLLETKGQSVFIPQSWTGINGMDPIELDIDPHIPNEFHTARRHVNPTIYDNAKKEFDRLSQYFYTESTTPYAHPLVIAPKATKPWIRFCGSYDLFANKHILPYHYPIPHVPDTIQKAQGFKYFIDLDLQNAFHQVPLGPKTRRLLGIRTPWGLFEPKFLPEGVGPASSYLQKVVVDIFADMQDFTITIFDNILICANTLDELYTNFERVLDRCIERNVYCKFSKTFLGLTEATFFGYKIRHDGYELTSDRKEAIMTINFPTSLKQAQVFFGSSVFFRSFVPDYTTAAQHLHDLLHKDFNWSKPDTWKHDYRQEFQDFKQALCKSCFVHFPDYSLEWVVRVDSSDFGIGGVVLQIVPPTDETAPPTYQPIAFVSHKYSDLAQRWSTIEKECYSCYITVKLASHLLMGKKFILETDHANLVWMEKSTVPKIIRWRMFLQSYDFLIRHIPGKQNIIADWFSRLYHSFTPSQLTSIMATVSAHQDFSQDITSHLDNISKLTHIVDIYHHEIFSPIDPNSHTDDLDIDLEISALQGIPTFYQLSPTEALEAVHNSKLGHHGIARTYRLLNKHFPGHRIPITMITDFIHSCPACQKHRLRHVPLAPINRVLHHPNQRSTLGIDLLTVTPESSDGTKYLIVIYNLFTKFVALYPTKDKTAESLAKSLLRHFSTYGLVDSIISDPGSDLTSQIIEHLNSYLGIRHTISLVDRHESNGVERIHQEILRHLRTMIHDSRLLDKWTDPVILSLVQLIINEQPNPALGNISPLAATFGTSDATYFRLPENPESSSSSDQYCTFVQNLDNQLREIRAAFTQAQSTLAQERLDSTPTEQQNIYQVGDHILKLQHHRPNKLSPQFLGPYEVISQHKNDITCKHLATHTIKVFHTDDIKIFIGTPEAALQAAMRDNDQHLISRILTFKGNPFQRFTTSFQVEFADGDIIWKDYDKDLSDTTQFEDFCRSHQYLWPLVYATQAAADSRNREIIKSPITYENNDELYVNLYAWTTTNYHANTLPDKYTVNYYVKATCSHKKSAAPRESTIRLTFPVFNTHFTVNNSFIFSYCQSQLPPNARLVTHELLQQHPKLP